MTRFGLRLYGIAKTSSIELFFEQERNSLKFCRLVMLHVVQNQTADRWNELRPDPQRSV